MSITHPSADDCIPVSSSLVRDALEILLLHIRGAGAAVAASYLSDTAASLALALFRHDPGTAALSADSEPDVAFAGAPA